MLEFGSSSKEERDKSKRQTFSRRWWYYSLAQNVKIMNTLGIEKSKGGVDLHEEAKKKGGTLNMEDLMKLHGVT